MSTDQNSEKLLTYSDYGYVKIEKKDLENKNHLIAFRSDSGTLYGSINKKSLKNTINIQLKTFYGIRSQYNLEISIEEPINTLINKLCEFEKEIDGNKYIQENVNDRYFESETPTDDKYKSEIPIYGTKTKLKHWKLSYQYRMITTNGYIHEIDPSKSFKEERIRDNQMIILLRESTCKFSEINKSVNVYLESRGKVAYKLGDDEVQLVLSDKFYNFGKKYIEFLLETEPYESSIVIGLSLKRGDYNLFLNDPLHFWGFILSECKKICYNQSNKFESTKYGEPTKCGDRVGILLEFKNNLLDVSYFINKINIGVAFKGLPIKQYYIAVGLRYDGTRVRILNNVGFPDV